MKSIFIPTFMAAVLAVSVTAEANKIESVIAVDYLNVEVMMKEPLTERSWIPARWKILITSRVLLSMRGLKLRDCLFFNLLTVSMKMCTEFLLMDWI